MSSAENNARYWLAGAAKLTAPILAEFSTKTVDIPDGRLEAVVAAMQRVTDAVDALRAVFEDDGADT